VIIALVLALSACHSQQQPQNIVNSGVINFHDFSLDASSIGLSTRAGGTVFVKGDLEKPQDITVQAVLEVELDPEDWGGVGLYFPEGWRVSGSSTSLVQIGDPYYSDLVSILTNGAPEKGGRQWVAVGYRPDRSGPGTKLRGTVVIDADFVWENRPTPEVLQLKVAAGSKDGYIMNPVSLDVSVPLLENMRPVRVQYLFPRQKQAEDIDASGQIEGELVLSDGQLRVNGYLVIWPFEYRGWSDTGTVWIRQGDETTDIARVGDTIVLPGREVNAYTVRQKTLTSSFPEGLAEPFWLAESVWAIK